MGVAVVIIGGTIYATREAQSKMLRFVGTLAARDGAASRAAYEALGADTAVAVGFEQRRLDWRKHGGEDAWEAFGTGVDLVEAFLVSFGELRGAQGAAWATTYAKGLSAGDFNVVRERMLLRVSGYDNGETNLKSAVESL